MKKIALLIMLIALVSSYFLFLNTNSFIQNREGDISGILDQSKAFVLGENDSFRIEVNSDDFNTGAKTKVWVFDKASNSHFVIDTMKDVKPVGVLSNAKRDLLVLSMGTSSVRTLSVYDIPSRQRIASDICSTGVTMWRDYVVYSDCSEIKDKSVAETRSSIVENGEYGPIVYKVNPRTDERVVLAQSDDLAIFSVQDSATSVDESSTSLEVNKIFVNDIKDWADTASWKTELVSVSLD